MKAKEIKQLHAKTVKELRVMLQKVQEELVKLRMGQATRKLKNFHQLMRKRHDIARIKTILREKELLESSEKEEARH